MLTFPSALATFWRIPLTAPCWTKTFTPRFSNNQIILVWNVSKNICYQGYPVHELSFLIFYAIPIFFLTFFYTCMINTIRRANTGIRRSAFRASNSNSKATDHRKQTIRMLGESHSVSRSSISPFLLQSAWSSSSSSPGPPSTSRDSAMSTSSRQFSSERLISICSISPVR